LFIIHEGPRYIIRKIAVNGNQHFEGDTIISWLNSYSGEFLLADTLEADRKRILEHYNADGYIYAAVIITDAFAEEAGFVDLLVQIQEGQAYNIGRIVTRGNTKTQDRVIRRVLDFYPGDTFDLSETQQSELRLRETRLFRNVNIEPQGTAPQTRDAIITVEEAETTRIMAGASVSSNSGLLGSLSIENWNFDLFDWPRTWGEFFRGQAFKGAGQTLKLSLEPGTELSQFRIDFREPYLMDLPISLGVSAYLYERDRDGYRERRAGTSVSLSKRFKKVYAVEAALRLEGVKVDDIDRYWWFFAPEDILEVEGWNMLTSLKLSLVRDTTDSFFMPSRGSRMIASWEQAGLFGGDFDFSKLIGQVSFYKTLRTDTFDRKTIWASNVEIGYISGDVPVFERFYGGGIGSMRGFEFRGISPRQCPDETAVGGAFQLLVGNELSFPLIGKTLRGVTFLDMGTVEEDFGVTTWRAAAGFGIRLMIDFFGQVPMSFDFAWPFSKHENDDTQVFSFSLGATF